MKKEKEVKRGKKIANSTVGRSTAVVRRLTTSIGGSESGQVCTHILKKVSVLEHLLHKAPTLSAVEYIIIQNVVHLQNVLPW